MGVGLRPPSGDRSAAPSSASGGHSLCCPRASHRPYSTIAYWVQQEAGVGRDPRPARPRRSPTAGRHRAGAFRPASSPRAGGSDLSALAERVRFSLSPAVIRRMSADWCARFRQGDLYQWSAPVTLGTIAMEDREIRAALDLHWAASDANDFEVEHQIYREDAVLEYPQSGERIRGRRNIQASRFAQPSMKRFTVRRILGAGDLWVTEFVLTYDGQPSYTVSVMEFKDGKVARETQYFGDAFEPGPSRARWVERMR